jgi:hypothetical protein
VHDVHLLKQPEKFSRLYDVMPVALQLRDAFVLFADVPLTLGHVALCLRKVPFQHLPISTSQHLLVSSQNFGSLQQQSRHRSINARDLLMVSKAKPRRWVRFARYSPSAAAVRTIARDRQECSLNAQPVLTINLRAYNFPNDISRVLVTPPTLEFPPSRPGNLRRCGRRLSYE